MQTPLCAYLFGKAEELVFKTFYHHSIQFSQRAEEKPLDVAAWHNIPGVLSAPGSFLPRYRPELLWTQQAELADEGQCHFLGAWVFLGSPRACALSQSHITENPTHIHLPYGVGRRPWEASDLLGSCRS